MSFNYLKLTVKGGETVHFAIADGLLDSDYSVIDSGKNQNRIRHMLAVLLRFKDNSFRPDTISYNIKITKFNGEYRLWAYTRNHKGAASYYAGIIAAHDQFKPNPYCRPRRRRITV